MSEPPAPFSPLPFGGTLRPSQQDAVEIVSRQLAAGERRLHIVAPPGAGKTVLGLYLWAEVVRQPALVLCPNSAIQSQWLARLDLFDTSTLPGTAGDVDAGSDSPLTALTYQSVTLPRRGGRQLDDQAVDLWCTALLEAGEADGAQEALVWIDGLAAHNPEYHAQRLSAYRKKVRDAEIAGGNALAMLHPSAVETVKALRERRIGLLILDECHHLTGHWGRVLADLHDVLGGPVVVGLTATPPALEEVAPDDAERYRTFFGPVDYEIPVPALVKDGFLAPYQDLAYFVRPTGKELQFIAETDKALSELVDACCEAREGRVSLDDWVEEALRLRRVRGTPLDSWSAFERRDPALADAGPRFLLLRERPLPDEVPPVPLDNDDATVLTTLVTVLDRYVRHHLRRSGHADDQALAETAIRRLRVLGVQITETGTQACASPVSRVLAYSRSKARALIPILRCERLNRGPSMRAAVICDYERTSVVGAEVAHLLDDEAGGALAAFRQLLTDDVTDALDPILVTGSSVLVDDDLCPRFLEEARAWLAERHHAVELSIRAEEGFGLVQGSGRDWCPRVYVGMVTELFQSGVSRCLVGTRGLLGEGWDATRLNVLVDLTAISTEMSVNQLRGRSIRLDESDEEKLASNWDVVCLAPEFRKGLDDYRRFTRRHTRLYGVTDDRSVEKGVGHVHPALTEVGIDGVVDVVGALNDEMLQRAGQRERARALWGIGEPFHNRPVRALEARAADRPESPGFPPFAGSETMWNDLALSQAIGLAVLGALRECKLLKQRGALSAAELSGGFVRLFLREADEESTALFAEAVAEALGPLRRPRYIIPRQVHEFEETWLSNLLPEIAARYFRRRHERLAMWHAVPSVLARNKELAAVYQAHWNRRISPGDVLYAHHGEGEATLDHARAMGLTPRAALHGKEVYL